MPLTLQQGTSLLVIAGDRRVSDRSARALAEALHKAGRETLFLGHETNARRIAGLAAEVGADAVEVCVAGGGAVPLLCELLRELRRVGRREVSILVRRVH
jgi:methylmalonyl-CoA mutase cobalamin-binding subunit